jgi:murein DD-endopeptidase MepM/ murein hydrolase activator NlpD
MLFTVLVITFSPLKRLMPGYGDIENNEKFLVLRQNVSELEKELSAQLVYTQGLQNMLTGEDKNEIKLDKSVEELMPDSDNFENDKYVSTKEIEESNQARKLDYLVFTPPVKGIISAMFDVKKEHYGIDIIAPKNTPILAAMEGIVVSADWSVETGNTVYLQHTQNIITSYKHNSALLVKTGDRVKTGQAIALIGNTGKLTDGPHLHFELWFEGQAVNPQNFVNFN